MYNHLKVPESWNSYFSKYPQGLTIMEALLDWVGQVDSMIDHINTTDEHIKHLEQNLEEFYLRFDSKLTEQIQNTLQSWIEDGTLEQVISQLIENRMSYPTIRALQQAPNIFKNGTVVELLGYHSAGDGSGHKRIIADEDDGSGVPVGDKWANIVTTSALDISFFGCLKGRDVDNSVLIQKAFDYACNKNIKLLVSTKYYFNTTVKLNSFLTIEGNIKQGGAGIYVDQEEDNFVGFVYTGDMWAFDTYTLGQPNEHYDGIYIWNGEYASKGKRNIAFRNLTIEGLQDNNSIRLGAINLCGVLGLELTNLKISRFVIGLKVSAGWGQNINNCFVWTSECGIYMYGNTWLRLENNYFSKLGWGADTTTQKALLPTELTSKFDPLTNNFGEFGVGVAGVDTFTNIDGNITEGHHFGYGFINSNQNILNIYSEYNNVVCSIRGGDHHEISFVHLATSKDLLLLASDNDKLTTASLTIAGSTIDFERVFNFSNREYCVDIKGCEYKYINGRTLVRNFEGKGSSSYLHAEHITFAKCDVLGSAGILPGVTTPGELFNKDGQSASFMPVLINGQYSGLESYHGQQNGSFQLYFVPETNELYVAGFGSDGQRRSATIKLV